MTATPDLDADPVDVLVVGFGPVGQVLAVLLAQQGWRTTVVERQPGAYPLPRAVSFDGHAARILAAAGIGAVLTDECVPAPDYEVVDAGGRSLLRVPLPVAGRYGWPEATSMYQPGIERALAARAAALPSLDVRRGHRVVAVHDYGTGVHVVAEDVATGHRRTLAARWVVGCDGANSAVRSALGVPLDDTGFRRDWMACDVLPDRAGDFPPRNLQIADPARPRVAVTAGPQVRRWEFMRLPHEPREAFGSTETAWQMLRLFGVHRSRARLVRSATYTVRGTNADRWRAGRVLLAGDAAHQMPPFIGQGMCSGLRDAANLAWKLDLVLGGTAGTELLSTYEEERRPDVQQAIDLSVDLGRLICGADAAPPRTRPATGPPTGPRGSAPSLPGPLLAGLLARGSDGRASASVGLLSPQGRVRGPEGTGLLDDVVGRGFVLLLATEPDELLLPRHRALLRRLHARTVHVVAGRATCPPGAVLDLEGVYLPWLRRLDAVAVLVRPDFYSFGGARDSRELAAMLDDLEAQLSP